MSLSNSASANNLLSRAFSVRRLLQLFGVLGLVPAELVAPAEVGLLGDPELSGYLGSVRAASEQPVGLDQFPHDLLRRVPPPPRHGDGAFLPTLVGHKNSHTTRTSQPGPRQN